MVNPCNGRAMKIVLRVYTAPISSSGRCDNYVYTVHAQARNKRNGCINSILFGEGSINLSFVRFKSK